jgi:hypothetical protein
MDKMVTAEFENIDAAERAAIAIRNRVPEIKSININTFFESSVRNTEYYSPRAEAAYLNAQGAVGYSMYWPGYGAGGGASSDYVETATRATATLSAVSGGEFVKTVSGIIRGLGAINVAVK